VEGASRTILVICFVTTPEVIHGGGAEGSSSRLPLLGFSLFFSSDFQEENAEIAPLLGVFE